MQVASLRGVLEELVKKARESREARELIAKACSHYPGKVLQFKAGGEKLYLVLYADGSIELKEGEYPAPDVHYIAEESTLVDMLLGRASVKALTRDWTLVVEGAMHETEHLLKLARLLLGRDHEPA